MMSFVHLSDLRLREFPEIIVKDVKPYERQMDTVESINQLEYKPKVVIITGDLSQNCTIQGIQQLNKYRGTCETEYPGPPHIWEQR